MSPKAVPFRYSNDDFIDPVYCLSVSKHNIDAEFPFHWHEFYEMEFVVQGEGIHILNGTTYRIGKGSLFLMSPAHFHSVIPQPGCPLKLVNVKFADIALSESLKRLLFSVEDDLAFDFDTEDRFQAMNEQFEFLYEEHRCDRLGKETMIRSVLERVIIELIRSVNPRMRPLDQQKVEPINKALSYIHQHYGEPLSLEAAAKQAGMSVTYFSELFHQETGFPFRTYLQHVRLQAAFYLTITSSRSVSEVCYSSGFNSLPHFYRAFKQKYGHSPNVLRKQANQEQH